MRIKWGKSKWTFVLIPEAERSVIRLRIQPWVLAGAGIFLFSLLLCAGFVYVQHLHTLHANAQLQAQISGQTAAYDHTLTGKNDAIIQLENQVIQLSQQAKEVKQKVDDMKQLEDDLRSISESGGISGKPVASAGSETGVRDGTALGGAYIPASDEEIKRLSEDTKTAFGSLTEQIDQLQESLTAVKADVLEKQHQFRITPTIWPTDIHTITSGFGFRKDPFTLTPSFHSGVDIGARLNDLVYVTADGTVVSTGSDSSHGNNIVIDHSDGIRTWYMHLSKILVSKGDPVEKGQKIGLVGSTGRSTGPHLHYEILKNGQSVDPVPYLKSTRKGE